MGLKSILITLLLCLPCFGQAPEIQGPDRVEPGQFILLQASSLDGFWLPDPELSGEYIQCSDRLGTSILTPGRYWFQYAVVDESGLLVAQHLVVVGKAPQPIPDPVPDQPGDDDSRWQEIIKTSEQGARSLADPTTAVSLADAIESVVGSGDGESMIVISQRVTDEVNRVLSAREGDQRFNDWLGKWRIPVNDVVSRSNIETTGDYIDAMRAVAEGLRQTQAGERN